MPLIEEVPIAPRSTASFEAVVGPERLTRFLAAARWLRARLGERVVWNVNSTAAGGGVAELLRSLVAYARGVGIDARWSVISGPPEFFALTKRLHHSLHGERGDGTPLDDAARSLYEDVTTQNALEFIERLRPGDIVLAHDPQTAGMISHLVRARASVVWRCHIGADHSDEETEYGWRFLAPYLKDAHGYVFTRAPFVPSVCQDERAVTIPPTIDPFSPKNQELSPETVHSILAHTGILNGAPSHAPRDFLREDGSIGRVESRAEIVRAGEASPWNAPLIVQVSRWDPLKDPTGVIAGFAALGSRHPRAELLLAGPDVHRVQDDPEGPEVFQAVVGAWNQLPAEARSRVHLVNLPMDDIEENGAIVNALQRHAAIVVQKSIREGFGLTVAEAMWKSRPVVATATGGIQDQIEDDRSGVLLEDSRNPDALARELDRLLCDARLASELGHAARERVREHFIGLTSLERWGALIDRVLDGAP